MLRAASIRSRLLTLFGLAVLPAIVLAAGLTWHVYRSVSATVGAYQRQTAINIASQIRSALNGTDIVASTLLASAGQDGDERFCAALPSFREVNRRILAYGFFRDGRLVCAAGDAAALAGFNPAAMASVASKGPQPAPGGNNRLETIIASKTAPFHLGVVSTLGGAETMLSVLSQELLRDLLERTPQGRSSPFAVVDQRFHIFAHNGDQEDTGWLPVSDKVLLISRNELVAGRGRNGNDYTYTSAPIEPGVAKIFSAKEKPAFGQAEQQLVTGLAVPLSIFAIVMAVAWLAIDRLFLQWMRRLGSAAQRLSYGDLNVRAELPSSAPLELQQYATAFDQMTEALGARTRELATVANQRSALLMELHHRVKNNFQVIASFLNLTKRQKSGETYEALALAECRVHAMASAYKLALAHGDIRLAPLRPLVHEVLMYVQQAAGSPAGVETSFAPDAEHDEQYLELDRAIPLALLLVEAIWPLLAGGSPGVSQARLLCVPEGRSVRLVIFALRDSIVTPSRQGLSMSRRLQQAFITQIDARELDGAALAAIRGDGQPSGRITLAISVPVHVQDHGPGSLT
ncbi:sensor histidine kinase [Camelimonas sp. ID_303_24]